MKILIVSQYFFPENFRLNDLAVGLVERGHEVTVVTGKPNYPEGKFFDGYGFWGVKQEDYHGVKVIRSPLIPRGKGKIQLALNYLSFPIFAILFNLRFLFTQKFDQVFVCQLSPIHMAIPAIFYRMIHRVPCSLWVTDLWPESLRASGMLQNSFIIRLVDWSVRWIYRNVDQILISCRGFKHNILERCEGKEPIFFPYWAEEFYQEYPREAGAIPEDILNLLKEDRLTLTFAGNVGEAQNLEVLIAAVKKLEVEELKRLRVMIIGDGRAKKKLLGLVKEYNLEGVFEFVGKRPATEMPYFFSISDALFLSLRKDPIFSITMPSKVQSYMACGRPIIYSIDGEARDVIEEAQCGLGTHADDAEGLASKLSQLLALEQNQLSQMGQNSISYFKHNFERSRAFSNLENTLRTTEIKGSF